MQSRMGERHTSSEDDFSTQIKVVGVGGAGCNAINRMIEEGINDVKFIAMNTDAQVLKDSLAQQTLQIGKRASRGLGAGARPDVGEKAAQEDLEEIKRFLEGTDMVFITAGMGGGTGTGAAPVVAKVAKEMGALTVAVVTIPFDFEGKKRIQIANEGIEKLKEHVDTMLVISNSRIFKVIERKAGIKDAFRKIDEVLKQAVQGISSIISDKGMINVDFADVRTVLSNRGEAIMGIGISSGENRGTEAARMAMENPLIENSSFQNAGAMLVNIVGGSDFTMEAYDEAAKTIQDYCHDDAEIIMGISLDDSLKDKMKIIVVATDFHVDEDFSSGDPQIPAEDIFGERKKVISIKDIRQDASPRRFADLSSERRSSRDIPVQRDGDFETAAYIRRRKRMG